MHYGDSGRGKAGNRGKFPGWFYHPELLNTETPRHRGGSLEGYRPG